MRSRQLKVLDYEKLKKDIKIKCIEKGVRKVTLLKKYGITPQALHIKNNRSYGTKYFIEKLKKLLDELGLKFEDYEEKLGELLELKEEYKELLGYQMRRYYKITYNNKIPQDILEAKLKNND